MDYEKEYKEALERFKKFKEAYTCKDHSISYEETQRRLEEVFPELKEKTELEKIIEEFKVFAESYLFWEQKGVDKNHAIAWLERQYKKHIPWYDLEEAKKAGYTIIPNKEYDRLTKYTEWSNSDKEMLEDIIHDLKFPGVNAYKKSIDKKVNWLKSLKQEWVGITQEQINLIAAHLDNLGFVTMAEELYSLRLRPLWKPSEEQMKALNEAIYHVDDPVATQLAMLIGSLKKL